MKPGPLRGKALFSQGRHHGTRLVSLESMNRAAVVPGCCGPGLVPQKEEAASTVPAHPLPSAGSNASLLGPAIQMARSLIAMVNTDCAFHRRCGDLAPQKISSLGEEPCPVAVSAADVTLWHWLLSSVFEGKDRRSLLWEPDGRH